MPPLRTLLQIYENLHLQSEQSLESTPAVAKLLNRLTFIVHEQILQRVVWPVNGRFWSGSNDVVVDSSVLPLLLYSVVSSLIIFSLWIFRFGIDMVGWFRIIKINPFFISCYNFSLKWLYGV